jgi:hypothetical protein
MNAKKKWFSEITLLIHEAHKGHEIFCIPFVIFVTFVAQLLF